MAAYADFLVFIGSFTAAAIMFVGFPLAAICAVGWLLVKLVERIARSRRRRIARRQARQYQARRQAQRFRRGRELSPGWERSR